MVTLFTFGCGARGELGLPRADDRCRPEASAVAFPRAQRPGAVESQITAIALGSDHSLAVVGGHVFRWGLLVSHTLPHWQTGTTGAGEVVPEPSPLYSWSRRELEDGEFAHGSADDAKLSGKVYSVACGGSNSFILTIDGEVFLFGDLRPPGGDAGSIRRLWGLPNARVVQIAAGWRHCLLLTESGEVYAFGDDEYGQSAGTGSGDVRLLLPTSLAVAGIAAGACHSLAWDASGSAFSWGHGGNGRLGVGSSEHCRSPRQIGTLPDPVFFASCGANFSLFATQNGRGLWACGGNQYGQLGLGGTSRSSQEVPVQLDLPRRNEEIVALECGVHHAICLTSAPATPGRALERRIAWAWGCASSGQCGLAAGERRCDGPPQSRSAPEPLVEFLAPSPYWPIAVAAGRSHSAVLAYTAHTRNHVATSLESAPAPMAPVHSGALSVSTVSSPGSAKLRSTAAVYPGTTNTPALRAAGTASWDAAVEAIDAANMRSATSWAVPPEVPPPTPWMSQTLHANSHFSMHHSQSAPHLGQPPEARSNNARRYYNAAPDVSEVSGDDIIDIFCATLAPTQAPRCLNFHSLVSSPPPSAVPKPCLRMTASPPRSPERPRSLSPVAVLVELGEAMLRGEDVESDEYSYNQTHAFQLRFGNKARRAVAMNDSWLPTGHSQKKLQRSKSDTRIMASNQGLTSESSRVRPQRMVTSGFLGRSAARGAERTASRSRLEDRSQMPRAPARESFSNANKGIGARRNPHSHENLYRSNSDSRLARNRDSRDVHRRDAFHGGDRNRSGRTRAEYELSDDWWRDDSMSDDLFGKVSESESNAEMHLKARRRSSKGDAVKKSSYTSASAFQPFNPFKPDASAKLSSYTTAEPYQPLNPFKPDASAELSLSSILKESTYETTQRDYTVRSSADEWRGVRESVNDLTSMIAGMSGSLLPQSHFGGGIGSIGICSGLNLGCTQSPMPDSFEPDGPLILTENTDLNASSLDGSPADGKLHISPHSRVLMQRSLRKEETSFQPESNALVMQPCPPPLHSARHEQEPAYPPSNGFMQTEAIRNVSHDMEPAPFGVNGGWNNKQTSPNISSTPMAGLTQSRKRSSSKDSTASSPSCKFTPGASAFMMDDGGQAPSNNGKISQQSPAHVSSGPSLQASYVGSHHGSHGSSPIDPRAHVSSGGSLQASHGSQHGSHSGSPIDPRGSSKVISPENGKQASRMLTQEPMLLGGNEDEAVTHFQPPGGGWDARGNRSTSSNHESSHDKNKRVNAVSPSNHSTDVIAAAKIAVAPAAPSSVTTAGLQQVESIRPFYQSSNSSSEDHARDRTDFSKNAGSDSSSPPPAFTEQRGTSKNSSGASSGSDSGSDSDSSSGASSRNAVAPNSTRNAVAPNSTRAFSPAASDSGGSSSSSGSSSGGAQKRIASSPMKLGTRMLSSGSSSSDSSKGRVVVKPVQVVSRQLSSGTSDAGESSASNSPPKPVSKITRFAEDTIVESLSGGDSGSDSDLAYTRTASRDVDIPRSFAQPASSPRTSAPKSFAAPSSNLVQATASPRTPAPAIAAPPPRPNCEDDMGIESLSD